LDQDNRDQDPKFRLEDLEAKLKTTRSMVLQKFLRTQIERLKQGKGGVGLPSRHPVMQMPWSKVLPKPDPAKYSKMAGGAA
jgi:hypothetical protein